MGMNLDARRRAMLAEMNIRVWDAPADDAGHAATAAAEAAEQTARVLARVAAGAAPSAPQASTQAPTPAAPAALVEHFAAPTPHPRPSVAEARPATLQPRPAGVADMDWPALEAAVAGCQACKLCTGRRNTVFGVGSRPADWLIVGEAPGENEDIAGEPFVGQAGKLLDNMLKAIGLHRQADAGGGVYIANVLKCRPPGNRNPMPDEVAQCEPFLRRQVELLRPRIILAMGRFAVQSLLQSDEPIGRLRGRVHAYHGVPVIVSYHPAYLLRSLPEKAKAWADLCLALDVMQREAPR